MRGLGAGVAAAVLIGGFTPAAAVNVPALLRDINQERVRGGSSPAGLIELDGIAYFAATTGSSGRELWRSDGTAAGTALVADLSPGEASGAAAPTAARTLAAWNGRLYLAADAGGRGYEPWALDLDRPRARLLRDASIRSLDPLSPAREGLLPLDPLGHAWRDGIVPGDVDPEPGILRDRSRPLVFYALQGALTLRLAKTESGEVAAAW